MRNGVSVRCVAALTVVRTSCGPLGFACKRCSAPIRSAMMRKVGEARSYGRQSHAGSCTISSSGANHVAVAATARICASSAAT